MVIFNFKAIAFAVLAFGLAWVILGPVLGNATDEAHLMLVGGPLLFLLDGGLRVKLLTSDPTQTKFSALMGPDAGGAFFYLPAWGFGLLWGALGISRVLGKA